MNKEIKAVKSKCIYNIGAFNTRHISEDFRREQVHLDMSQVVKLWMNNTGGGGVNDTRKFYFEGRYV